MVTLANLKEILEQNNNEIILLIFSASWCGPCKKLKEKLKDENDTTVEKIKDLKYLIIDVDDEENENICNIFKVKGLPHQVLISIKNNGIQVHHKIIGYNFEELVNTYIILKN